MHGAVLICSLAVACTAGAEVPSHEKSARVEATAYVVTARAVGRAAVGTLAEVELLVETRAGYHLNDDYPLNVRPLPSTAATFEKARVAREDGVAVSPCRTDLAHGCQAKVHLRYTPTRAGRAGLGGTFAFSACNADRCLIEKVDVEAKIEIFAR